MSKLAVGERVYHSYDYFKRVGTVTEVFNWLGQRKACVKLDDGDRLKDYDYFFVRVPTSESGIVGQ